MIRYNFLQLKHQSGSQLHCLYYNKPRSHSFCHGPLYNFPELSFLFQKLFSHKKRTEKNPSVLTILQIE